METAKKKFWLSKTFWFNLVCAILAGVWPTAQEYLVANPTIVASAFAAINIILRWISKEQLTLLE